LITVVLGNAVTEITIESRPHQFKYLNIGNNYAPGLFAYLSQRRQSFPPKSPPRKCRTKDIYVNYIYEYDLHNQAFNSSFQNPNSVVVQGLQSNIADEVSGELYKRNLLSYIKDKVRLTKIIDVSKQYNDRSTIRFYVSINLRKDFIPVVRRVLELVFEKIQKERFSSTKKNIDWGNMVIIPMKK
jgi:hypothetical protein